MAALPTDLGVFATTAPPETPPWPNPYVIWVENVSLPPTMPPLPENCYGCDCMSVFHGQFVDPDGHIHDEFTCLGGAATRRIPRITWSGPKNAAQCGSSCQSFAAVLEDLDYPNGMGAMNNEVHTMFWAANIPGDWTELSDDKVFSGAPDAKEIVIGLNVAGVQAMEPICPTKSTHRYKFTLWALKDPLDTDTVNARTPYATVLHELSSHEMAHFTFFAEVKAPKAAHHLRSMMGLGPAPAPAPAPAAAAPAAAGFLQRAVRH